MDQPRETRSGPWLVALGAALWGTESAWRIPLNGVLAADVLVFWEHVLLVALALPFVIPRLGELRRVRWQTIAWLVFSGVAGSAVGAVLFTLAIAEPHNATIANVVLNLQPVLSTSAAVVLFRDKLARGFWPWAIAAVVAGAVLAFTPGAAMSVDAGTGYALACALCWGLSTVAGRGVMVEMSLPLAAGLRVVVGLACMTIIVAARGLLTSEALWPAAASAKAPEVIAFLVLLATFSGAIPLVIYFAGLARTRASTAGYFEMMQTIAAVAITWGWFHKALEWYQVLAALALMFAVAMVQRAQASVET